MVPHQTVSQHLYFVDPGVFFQPLQVADSICVVEKYIGAAVSALRDVVWDSGEYDPCESRHALRLAEAGKKG